MAPADQPDDAENDNSPQPQDATPSSQTAAEPSPETSPVETQPSETKPLEAIPAPPQIPLPTGQLPDQATRYHDAYAAADQSWQQRWQQGPGRFKSSLETPPTPTNEYRQAEAQSDENAREGQLAERQEFQQAKSQQEEAQKGQNADREAQFRGSNQKFYKDPYGNLQPVVESGTNRPLYDESQWNVGQHPKTGEPVLQKTDRYGQRQFKPLPVVASPDPNDHNLYYQMPDGSTKAAGSTNDLINSPNLAIQRIARKQQAKEINEHWKSTLANVSDAHQQNAVAPFQAAQANLQNLDAQLRQAKDLDKANILGANVTAVTGDAAQTAIHNKAYIDQLTQQRDLAARASTQAKLSYQRSAHLLNSFKAQHQHDNFVSQEEERNLILQMQGKDPATDPTLESIRAGRQAMGNAAQYYGSKADQMAKQQAQLGQSYGAPTTDQFQAQNPGVAQQVDQTQKAAIADTVPPVPSAAPTPAPVAPTVPAENHPAPQGISQPEQAPTSRPSLQPQVPGPALHAANVKVPDPLKQQWAQATTAQRLGMLFGSKGYGQTEVQGASPIIGSEAAGTKGSLFTVPKAQGEGALPGVIDAANEFTAGLTSPENVGLMAATGGAAKLSAAVQAGTKMAIALKGAKALALAGFGVQQASDAGEKFQQAREVLADPKATPKDKAHAVAGAILSAAMGVAAGHGAIHEAGVIGEPAAPGAPADTGTVQDAIHAQRQAMDATAKTAGAHLGEPQDAAAQQRAQAIRDEIQRATEAPAEPVQNARPEEPPAPTAKEMRGAAQKAGIDTANLTDQEVHQALQDHADKAAAAAERLAAKQPAAETTPPNEPANDEAQSAVRPQNAAENGRQDAAPVQPEVKGQDQAQETVPEAAAEGSAQPAAQPGDAHADAGAQRPAAERVLSGEDVSKMKPDDFVQFARTSKGGFTAEAERVGAEATGKPDAIQKLRDQYAAAQKEFHAAEPGSDDQMALASKAQFFSEALQKAEGTGNYAPKATPKAETPVAKPEPAAPAETPKASISEKGKALADRIRKLKIDTQGKSFSVGGAGYVAAHNTAIEVAAQALEQGSKVVEAVRQGMQSFKEAHPEATKEQTDNLRDSLTKELGGEKPAAPKAPKEETHSIKNETVDQAVKDIDKDPITKEGTRAFGQNMQEAADEEEVNPAAGENLVREINDNPRPISDKEDAILLRHQIRLKNALKGVTDQMAKEAGDGSFSGRMAELQQKAAKIRSDMYDAFTASKLTGTEQGRALNARKMLAREDYSLAQMENRLRLAQGGKELSDTQRTAIQKLSKQLEDTQKAHDDYVKAAEEKHSKEELDRKVAEIVREAARAKAKAPPQNVVSKFIDDQAAAARQRIKERLSGARVNDVTSLPAHVADLAIVGAKYLKDGIRDLGQWSHEMLKDFGHDIEPNLKEIYAHAKNSEKTLSDAAAEKRDFKGERKSTIDKLKERVKEGDSISNMGRYVQSLAEQFVKSGITDPTQLRDAVHGELVKVDPEITPRQTQDAISGYGDFKPLSDDVVKRQLSDAKGQLQAMSKLEDMRGGKAPAKTGVERRVPSDAERRLIQQVNEMKRKGGFNVTDPATQLRTSLEAMKTRLRNSISDLDHQIATRQKTVKTKTAVTPDPEALKLQEQRDALKDEYDKIFPKQPATDAQRAAAASKSLDRQIAETERQLRTQEVFPKGQKAAPSTPEIEAKRARLDALKEEREYMRQSLSPEQKSPAEIADQAYKTRLTNRIADLQERIAKGDTSRPVRTPPERSPEALKLQETANRTKLTFDRMEYAKNMESRPQWQKASEQAVGYLRAGALSGYHVLAKIAAFSPHRLIQMPVEEGAAHALSKVPAFEAAQNASEFERPASAQAIGKIFTTFFTEGLRKAGQQLASHETDSSLAFGKSSLAAPKWYDFFGNLHKSMKTPLLTAAHEFYYQKGIEAAVQDGLDVTDPIVQGGIRARSYQYANRSILQENNEVASWYNHMIGKARKQNAKGELNSPAKAIAADAIESLLTKGIVKTPTNYVAQTLEGTPAGLAYGAARAMSRVRKGFADMTPEQRNSIGRLLKVGAVGSAAFAYGMYDATRDPKDRTLGGYYEPGDKRDPNDVNFGALRVGGSTLSHIFTHSPPLEAAQMGSTMMRVFLHATGRDAIRKDPRLAKEALRNILNISTAAPLAAVATGGDLLQESPVVGQIGTLGKLADPNQRNQVAGDMAASFVPGLISDFAKDTDKTPRRPKDVEDRFNMSVPGLRQTVPAAQPRKR